MKNIHEQAPRVTEALHVEHLSHSDRKNGAAAVSTSISKFRDLTQGISSQLSTLRGDLPDVMKGFSELARAATREGALDKKTKELIALAIGVAARCDGCIGFHVQSLVSLGATKMEVQETLAMAVYMGAAPVADVLGQCDGRVRRTLGLPLKIGPKSKRSGGRVAACFVVGAGDGSPEDRVTPELEESEFDGRRFLCARRLARCSR
jgi:AhpD family alkylhydroperoxidase